MTRQHKYSSVREWHDLKSESVCCLRADGREYVSPDHQYRDKPEEEAVSFEERVLKAVEDGVEIDKRLSGRIAIIEECFRTFFRLVGMEPRAPQQEKVPYPGDGWTPWKSREMTPKERAAVELYVAHVNEMPAPPQERVTLRRYVTGIWHECKGPDDDCGGGTGWEHRTASFDVPQGQRIVCNDPTEHECVPELHPDRTVKPAPPSGTTKETERECAWCKKRIGEDEGDELSEGRFACSSVCWEMLISKLSHPIPCEFEYDDGTKCESAADHELHNEKLVGDLYHPFQPPSATKENDGGSIDGEGKARPDSGRTAAPEQQSVKSEQAPATPPPAPEREPRRIVIGAHKDYGYCEQTHSVYGCFYPPDQQTHIEFIELTPAVEAALDAAKRLETIIEQCAQIADRYAASGTADEVLTGEDVTMHVEALAQEIRALRGVGE